MIKLLLFVGLIAVVFWLGKRFMTPPAMPREEAAKLLGVAPDAPGPEVIEAHKRLIAKVHPDAGGTPDLAARINRARDTLLK